MFYFVLFCFVFTLPNKDHLKHLKIFKLKYENTA